MLEEKDLIGSFVEFGPDYRNPGSTGLSHDGIYLTLGTCNMKDSKKRWIEAVKYTKCKKSYGEWSLLYDENDPGKYEYIRDKEDFIKKFVKIDTFETPLKPLYMRINMVIATIQNKVSKS